jgi:hypothetical protein
MPKQQTVKHQAGDIWYWSGASGTIYRESKEAGSVPILYSAGSAISDTEWHRILGVLNGYARDTNKQTQEMQAQVKINSRDKTNG